MARGVKKSSRPAHPPPVHVIKLSGVLVNLFEKAHAEGVRVFIGGFLTPVAVVLQAFLAMNRLYSHDSPTHLPSDLKTLVLK